MQKKICSTEASHILTDYTTSSARRSLTSEIGRDRVYFTWYDRRWKMVDDSLYINHNTGSECEGSEPP